MLKCRNHSSIFDAGTLLNCMNDTTRMEERMALQCLVLCLECWWVYLFNLPPANKKVTQLQNAEKGEKYSSKRFSSNLFSQNIGQWFEINSIKSQPG